MKPTTTAYEIERQWCGKCHKEVRAQPVGVIPGSRLGMNLLVMAMIWHYRFRVPFRKIAEKLNVFYGIHVSEGTIVSMLKKASDWLEGPYEKLITEIRAAPVKHADETSWPVGSNMYWAWVFTTKKETLYTIEETRGGGIAKEKLEGARGILVRDDYGAYTKLPIIQQFCWAHLLRKSHEEANREDASDETKKLHKNLKELFVLLQEDCLKPFEEQERQERHNEYRQDIEAIINTTYRHADAQRVQTRIKNQRENLLTALLYPDVPLTNNLAEQAVLPLVITRKISRGSKTPDGAKTHAVNMSIIETITKQKLPVLDTLQNYLLKAATEKR